MPERVALILGSVRVNEWWDHLGPPAGTAIIALLEAGIALLVQAEGIEVLATAGVYHLHALLLHKSVLGGGPPNHAARFCRKTVQPLHCIAAAQLGWNGVACSSSPQVIALLMLSTANLLLRLQGQVVVSPRAWCHCCRCSLSF